MGSILVVDDEPALCEALTESLADLGHAAHTTACGEDALAFLEAQRVDAVFLDLRMPGMDGIEVLRRIRNLEAAPVVTVLTAHATAANTIEAMRLGAFDHLTKPISRSELAAVLGRMLASRAPLPDGRSSAQEEPLIGSSAAMREIQKTLHAHRQQRHRVDHR